MWRSLTVLLPAILPFIRTEEYCQWEEFRATCQQNEVVMMQEARYGRMGSGRCIETDFGFVGCSADVLALTDMRCSGRRECKILIPDKELDTRPKCPKDLSRYLEAEYQCIKVVDVRREDCFGKPYKVPVKQPAYIASITTEETSCGSTAVPWRIEAKPGQRINITMVDFNLQNPWSVEQQVVGEKQCRVYCIIKDNGQTTTICGGAKRVKHAYTSNSHIVDVRVLAGASGRQRYFLLKYEVIGCPDPEVPLYGWAKRHGTEGELGCSESGSTWRIVCKDTHWVGGKPNCSEVLTSAVVFGRGPLTQTLSIAIIAVIAIAIGTTVLIVGLFCLMRKKRRRALPQPPTLGKDSGKEYSYSRNTSHYLSAISPNQDAQNDSSGENEYEYVGDIVRPQAPATYMSTNCPRPAGQNMTQHNVETAVAADEYYIDRSRSKICSSSSAPQYYELDPDMVPRGGQYGGLSALGGSRAPPNTYTDDLSDSPEEVDNFQNSRALGHYSR